MALTSAGAQLIAQMVNAESVTAYGNSTCYIAVGSGTTAFNSAQTALVTPLTGGRKLVTSGTRSGSILTKATSYGTTEAEGSWEEWAWFNSSSGATMLGRKVESLGTKPAGTQTWQFETTVTFSA